MLVPIATLLATAGAQTPIACCDHPDVQNAVAGVATLTQAVAAGGGEKELAALHTWFEVDASLPAPDRSALARIGKLSRDTSEEPDDVLARITRHAVFLLLRHEGGDLVLAEGFCPERGGWIQLQLDQPRSPWTGCGGWR